MIKKIDGLRRRPELVIPSVTLLVGLIVLSLLPTLVGTPRPKFVISQAHDHLRRGPVFQPAQHSAPLGQPINAPTAPTTTNSAAPATVTALSSALIGPRAAPRGLATGRTAAAAACPSPALDMKILVLSADGNETDLPAITQSLDYMGTPYSVYIATKTPGGLTAGMLASGCHANYQGVILATGLLAYNNGSQWVSALAQPEWNALWAFEAAFGVRQVSWYTFPTADFGFQAPTQALDTSANVISATYTPEAKPIFSYVNLAGTLPIQYAYTYLAQPLADGNTTTLLTDAQGDALAAIHKYPDHRQNLALTVDSNQYLIHSIVLSYGLINWVTKGIFIGERHVYLQSQIDDIFLDDNTWAPATVCGTSVDTTATTYRINGADFHAAATWQKGIESQRTTRFVRLDMAFNGQGSTQGAYEPDSLTPQVKREQGQFYWTNHTYDHLNLDTVDYATAQSEILQNDQIAQHLGLRQFSPLAMVTPDISGLTNPQFLQGAYDAGIRYVVSDTSIAGYNNPSPNAGIYNRLQPGILMIPRHPTNLFFNVSTPEEEGAEYNCIYHGFWGRNLSYGEILDQESQTLLISLLKGDIDPAMYHQPNLRAYDGTHSLLGDLLDRTFAKYNNLYSIPIKSLREDIIGQTIAQRMQFAAAGVTASVRLGSSVTLTAQASATIPVTGLRSQGDEYYGGQAISYITLAAGQSLTLPRQ